MWFRDSTRARTTTSTKPYDAHELKARLRAGRRIIALQEALLSARDALRFQATLDPLTGLWNRKAIMDTLKRELVRAEREGTTLTVLTADLDHFSGVNETYGHMAGDSVLRETARRIRDASRFYDTVGRTGGEEFTVIAPGCCREDAVNQAERIRASITGKELDLSEGMIRLTMSVGLVTTDNKKGVDPIALLSVAHAALTRAKSMGRNRVEMATPDEIQSIVLAPPDAQAA